MIESQLRILHPNPKNLPWGGDSKVHFIEPRRWTSPFTIFVSRRCRGSFGCRWAGLLAAGLTPLPVLSLWPLANRPGDVTMSALFLPRFLCHPFFFFPLFFPKSHTIPIIWLQGQYSGLCFKEGAREDRHLKNDNREGCIYQSSDSRSDSFWDTDGRRMSGVWLYPCLNGRCLNIDLRVG